MPSSGFLFLACVGMISRGCRAFGDPYGESPAPCGTVRRTVPPGRDRRLRRGRTGCSIPVQSLTKKQNKRKSTCLTRKQVLLVVVGKDSPLTRTGISRGLKNSPLDCFLRTAVRRPCPGPRHPHRAARISACPLRPLALLRLPVSAAGGGRLRGNSSYGSKKMPHQPELSGI